MEHDLDDLVLDRVAGVVDLELVEEVVVEARDARRRLGGREERPTIEDQRDAAGRGARERVDVRHVHRRIELDVGRVLMVRRDDALHRERTDGECGDRDRRPDPRADPGLEERMH